nr:PREDICTED: ubiquitin domain-containing protein 1 [Opisthocomus hoazin]
MTAGQLRSKRDEFWDTAPAFEGRKEIWDALKAAAYAVEANDHSLAQAILDGASITLPHGSLTECYDELGNRYQLPVYCLAPPVNLILERSEEEAAEPAEPLPNARREFTLKVRLSTGKDLRLSASMGDTIGQLKKQLQVQEGIDLAWQRLFFLAAGSACCQAAHARQRRPDSHRDPGKAARDALHLRSSFKVVWRGHSSWHEVLRAAG